MDAVVDPHRVNAAASGRRLDGKSFDDQAALDVIEFDTVHRDRATCLGFIEQFLAPKLKPGDVVEMHNLVVHKVIGRDDPAAARRHSSADCSA